MTDCERLKARHRAGERESRHRLTECQAVRANAGTLTCRPDRSGAEPHSVTGVRSCQT